MTIPRTAAAKTTTSPTGTTTPPTTKTPLSERIPTGMIQFLIFLAIAAVVIPFGVNYIAGPEGFGKNLTLHAHMEDAFGLTVGTGVSVRGVDVGTVSKVTVSSSGADIDLVVRNVDISASSIMQVTMASMAGIQSVDIIPTTDAPPYLRDGDTIAAPADKQPKQMDAIIADAAKLLRTMGPGNLSTISAEMYAAFADDTDSLNTLVGNGATLAALVRRNAPVLRGILGDMLDVLGAMDNQRANFESGMRSMATFTDQLDANQPVFVYLLDHSPKALTHAQKLFDRYRGTFGGVLANLATVEPIISDRDAALSTGLKTIPRGLYDLRSIVKNGRADFALIGTQGPVCMFYDEPRRTVGDLSPSAPNLTRYCPPGNGYGQRGAVNAPRPNDLGTADYKRAGKPSGPAAATDPILVPNGAELLQWWQLLLERARNGK